MATKVQVSDLIDRLTRLAGQVPGTSVQAYGQDTFLDMLNSTIRMVARKYWWPELMHRIDTASDGVTGVVTADLSAYEDWKDLRFLFIDNWPNPLARMSNMHNPLLYTSSIAMGWEALPTDHASYASKLIRLFPYTVQHTVTLIMRMMPARLRSTSDYVFFDEDLIVFGVLWQYFEDEGDNPQQAARYKALFDSKYNQIVGNIAEQPLSTNGNMPPYPGEWMETF